MPKIVGRNASIYIDDSTAACTAMSGDLNSATLTYGSESTDVTGFGDNTRQRAPDGIKDFTLEISGFIRDTAGAASTLHGIVSGSTFVQFGPNGSAAGGRKFTGCMILVNIDQEYAVEGPATFSATLESRSGSLTASTW